MMEEYCSLGFVHGCDQEDVTMFQVGLACCQIGRSQGMVVIGTAGTDEGLKLIRDHGATHAFNHREAGYQQQIQVPSVCFVLFLLQG
jgi:hypothetical protein